jgi:ABC-2 type transport system permease protein
VLGAVDLVGAARSKGYDLNGPAVSPYAYTTPANLVLFVFIVCFVTSTRLAADRSLGVTRRILATPTSPTAVVLAELGTAFVVAVSQALFLVLMGLAVFDVHWGDPVGTLCLVVVLCLTGAAAGVTLGTSLRSPDQVVAIGVPLGLVLGMLGGCMWPLAVVGPVMRSVGHLVPTAWAMDAFTALVFGRVGIAGVAVDLGVLAGFAVALLLVATSRLRRMVLS